MPAGKTKRTKTGADEQESGETQLPDSREVQSGLGAGSALLRALPFPLTFTTDVFAAVRQRTVIQVKGG